MATSKPPGIKTRLSARELHALMVKKPPEPKPNWLHRIINAIARKWLFRTGHGS